MTDERASEAPSRRVVMYDFRRPDKFSKDQIRTISIMHETFARRTTAALSAALSGLAHAHVALVDQLTYEEFIRAIPNPTTLGIISMEPLKGSAILEIDPNITSCLIDRLFGGKGEEGTLSRELTDIESAVMEGVISRLLGNLREAWAAVTELRPRLAGFETNPMFAQIVPPSEMVVLVSLLASFGGTEGMMNLCVPYLTIESVLPRLSAQYIFSSARRSTTQAGVRALHDHMADLPVSAEVCRDAQRLSLREIGALKKGSRLRIPEAGRTFLRMGGHEMFRLETRHGRRGQPDSYGVSGEIRTRLIPGSEGDALAARLAEMESRLRASLGEVASGLQANLSGLAKGISALERRQSTLADQLAFSQSEPPAAGADLGGDHRLPFDAVRRADAPHVLGFIRQEHPQLIALVLSYLEPHKASEILAALPAETQPEVVRRIAEMRRTSPDVLRVVEEVLEKKLAWLSSAEYTPAGGVQSAVEILNLVDRSTEKNVVESLQRADPKLAEEITRSMFVFEDIKILEKESIRMVLQRVERDVLLRALKAAPDEVCRLLLSCMSPSEAEEVKKQSEEMRRLRLSEVEKAQLRIVAIIREMEESGEIVIARPGETVE